MPRPSDETGQNALDDLVGALDVQIQTIAADLAARRTAAGVLLPSTAVLLEKLRTRLFISVHGYMLYFTDGRTCYIDPRGASVHLGYTPTEEMMSRFLAKIADESFKQK
ncbi:hypothetical protein [Herbaspirillum sp. RV1423]|uniref:hypothetical protein n=1 Tax=Herbaspirillum sp. RV1423 TaxID=1443993 RepID=UPI0012DDB722|nr:hypothetical protein [Herbaspirillum sp. RV1423]